MSIAAFEASPSSVKHEVYKNSLLDIAASEYSEGEDLLGSAYRGLLLGIKDRNVNGLDIKEIPARITDAQGGHELWHSLLLAEGGLASPERMQKRSGIPELMPIVPKIAFYAGVRGGSKRRRWFPANLLMEVIGTGKGLLAGQVLVNRLRAALEVDLNDDVTSRFINQAIPNPTPTIKPTQLNLKLDHTKAYCKRSTTRTECVPAERFCADLVAIIDLKPRLTRRQWTVLLEAILRLGMTSHTLWICHANARYWELVQSVASGQPVPNQSEIESAIWGSLVGEKSFLEIGGDSKPLIYQALANYVYGRFGLNILLHRLDDISQPWLATRVLGNVTGEGDDSPQVLRDFLQHVATHRVSIDATDAAQWLRTKCMNICDHRLPLMKCKASFTRNMWFFLRHGLGQIETSDPEQKAYDQSFLVVKRGKTRWTKWLVEPGPAMLIALVHACCHAQEGLPTSLEDFRLHLAGYGLHAPAGELLGGNVGTALERLGLVVDSPDAAGGRLLVAPFSNGPF